MTKGPAEVTILKLGGSLITNKDVPDSINQSALNQVAKALREFRASKKDRGLILVHGGGSFGHYYARRAGLSTKPSQVSPVGIARTNNAMQRLHTSVITLLLSRGVFPETILPSELLTNSQDELSSQGLAHVLDSWRNGLVPITLGYVTLNKFGARVISGDEICLAISNSVNVKRVIFALDVDGIYPDPTLHGEIIRSITKKSIVGTSSRLNDVTGGIKSKLEIGLRLYDQGIHVFYVNGMKPRRLTNLLQGKKESRATRISSEVSSD